MKARIAVTADGALTIGVMERTLAHGLRFAAPAIPGGRWETTPWEADAPEPACFRSVVRCGGETILVQQVTSLGAVVTYCVELHAPLEGVACADSFEAPAVIAPAMELGEELSALLVTYGLGAADDPFGGYWPAVEFRKADDLTARAFAPLVVYDEGSALAISPASQFLTSALVAMPRGVGRGIHGAVDRLETGTQIETLFVVGSSATEALMALGDELLRRGGKRRAVPGDHPLTSGLGWWNAYGGYYTEPIRPLEETGLRTVLDDARERPVPLRYVGLDLWYPYEQIGQATEFVPDPKKYPCGIAPLVREGNLPTALHISALASRNAYASDGSEGRVYADVAAEIQRQHGIVVWHDWMRTQQHLSRRLRQSPDAAESWYRAMARAFRDRDLNVLQCMQTMGMALASTAEPNVLAARTSIDYLFAQPEALDTLAAQGDEGFRREAVRSVDLWRQNLLMGTVLYAVGLLPFHDLFLTTFHPGLGGARALGDAVVRALSCGPVGIGDGPGQADLELLSRLIATDGRILHPDRPLFPEASTLGSAVETYWTLHRAGAHAWLYVVLLNLSDAAQPFDVAPPLAGEYVIRDGLRGAFVEAMRGELEPGALAFFALSPVIAGVSPVGLLDRFVSAPSGGVVEVIEGEPFALRVRGLDGRFGIRSERPIEVLCDGRAMDTTREDGVTVVALAPDHREVTVLRR
ncbi:MAG: hypothetical protein JSW65_02565 [Candidatus Bipolaricaulota bacterium]|nr:MAG: hypothetical protein JSW65_02565 [Candidatus Bipolaricaulota bacterium]